MIIRIALLVTWFTLIASPAYAKFALLVGVSKYEHPRLNETQLKFPEEDAKAIAQLLEKSGYKVQLLIGKQATAKAIGEAMARIAKQGNADDVLLLGFFGHGVQYGESAYYCPYDTDLRVVKDADGKEMRDNGGLLRQEPDPATMVSMRQMLDALTLSKAGSKLLLADCCREDPSRARGGLRGRAFGEGLQVNQLPTNSAALFACGPGQQAYEHDDWKHGAFTRAFLDVCESRTEVTANELSALLYRRVNELIANKRGIDSKQTVSNVTRDLVDLKLNRRPDTKMSEGFVNSVGVTMKLIPRGTFMMGSQLSAKEVHARYPGGDVSFYEDEHPRHQVTISQPFYMGIHEVTVAQFRKFVEAISFRTDAEKDDEGGYGMDLDKGVFKQAQEFNWRNPGFQQRDNEPVVNVSWNDANAFCKWLSQKEGKEYRLPTEAEWEYACRAGSDSEFHFGDQAEEITKFANVVDATFKQKFPMWTTMATRDGQVFTAPVGSYTPNAFGLFDMHGNVAEWCTDGYDKYTLAATTDPKGLANAKSRIFRGGSWGDRASSCRSATRYKDSKAYRFNTLGFRLVSVVQ